MFSPTNIKKVQIKIFFQFSHCQRFKRLIISEIGEEDHEEMSIVGGNVSCCSLLGAVYKNQR